MIDLSRHIEYLLLYNDKVEVPSLGTFTATYVESKWIEEENLFLPPYRSVAYRQEVENGDDFLKSLSKQYNISMSEAGILCLEFTENILQELYDNGTSDIGGIGYFVQENENDKRVFIPCEAGVASPSLYGLDSVYALPTNNKQTDDDAGTRKRPKKLPTLTADKDYVTIRINRRLANYVAAIAASVVFFFLATTPAVNNITSDTQQANVETLFNNNIQESIKATVDNKNTAAVEAVTPLTTTVTDTFAIEQIAKNDDATEEIETTETAEENVAEATESAKTEETSIASETPEPKKEAPKPAAKPKETTTPKADIAPSPAPAKQEEYAVVLASALSMKNAESYVKDLMDRGYKVCLQAGEKMNRVIIPGFKNMDEARAKIKEMKETSDEFENAWALKLN